MHTGRAHVPEPTTRPSKRRVAVRSTVFSANAPSRLQGLGSLSGGMASGTTPGGAGKGSCILTCAPGRQSWRKGRRRSGGSPRTTHAAATGRERFDGSATASRRLAALRWPGLQAPSGSGAHLSLLQRTCRSPGMSAGNRSVQCELNVIRWREEGFCILHCQHPRQHPRSTRCRRRWREACAGCHGPCDRVSPPSTLESVLESLSVISALWPARSSR